MKKKTALIIMICLLVVGSFYTFYSGNLLSSDLSNMFYGTNDAYIIASLPMFMITLDFIVGIIFLTRYYHYPQYRVALIKLYTVLGCVFSILGVITGIITGTVIYGSFIKPYPFPGATLIILLVNLLIFAACLFIRIKANKLEPDKEVKKIKLHNVVYSGTLGVLLFFALFRFGSFLWAPFYIQWRTFYLTFPFYIWTLLPMALVVHIVLYFLECYKDYKHAIIYTGLLFILNLVLSFTVMAIGYTTPTFISAISPALPLERLATKPLDVLIDFAVMLIVSVYYFFYSVRSKKIADGNK